MTIYFHGDEYEVELGRVYLGGQYADPFTPDEPEVEILAATKYGIPVPEEELGEMEEEVIRVLKEQDEEIKQYYKAMKRGHHG